jgi:BASS family bile acid:Na+ symporter
MNVEKIVAVVMLVSLTFGAGLEVNRAHLIEMFKNSNLLFRALLANFVIVPALGVALAWLFRLPPHVETGFLLMAIAPGVPFVLASARKRGGHLSLAVALAFFLPLLSIITIPFTAKLVLPEGASAHVPLARFLLTLVLFQLVPLLLGIVVGQRNAKLSERLARPLQILFFASALVLVAVLSPQLARDISLVYGSRGMWAMLSIVLLSLGIGWLLGGPAREDRRILAIGTALRNVGLGALIATSDFSEATIAATVITYFLIQFVVTTLCGAYFARTARTVPA